eukprot:7948067-Prorocentrum_lima.AAC.1
MGALLGCGHAPVFKEHGSFLWLKNGKRLALHRHGNLFFLKVRKALIAPLTHGGSEASGLAPPPGLTPVPLGLPMTEDDTLALAPPH